MNRRWISVANHHFNFLWCSLLPLVFLILIMTGSAIAVPTLEQTQLYSKYTSSCRSIALDHWRHPTAQKKADITLKVAPQK